MVGRNREIFFMRYWKLPEPHTVSPTTIPRFTEEEKQAEMRKHRELPMSKDGTIKLKDIIDNAERINITALPHHVYQKWYFGRIVTIGDAAHKFNPLIGQGGNNCIESAAALVNHLRRALRTAKVPLQSPVWPASAVEAAFSHLQQQRLDRVTDHVDKCQQAQRVVAWDTWFYQFLGRYVQPYMSPEKMADGLSQFIVGALKLDGDEWHVVNRKHKLPWEEESKPEKRGNFNITAVVTSLSVAVLVGYAAMRSRQAGNGGLRDIIAGWHATK